MRITSSSLAFRSLQALQSFDARGVVPGEVPLEPADTLLGVLALKGHAAMVLLDCGAYLRINDEWQLVPYADINVRLPATDATESPLVLDTALGSVEIPSGTTDALEAGRFFMQCAEDAGVAARPTTRPVRE